MKFKVGIFNGFFGGEDSYELYIKACKDLGVDYEVVDIIGANWMENVWRSRCDGFLVRPSPRYDAWKRMFDERLYFIERKLNRLIYPTYDELFMYENKRIAAYWMELHHIPHARTRVFYDRAEAMQYLDETRYPIVFKTHIGATSTGVKILRTRAEARRLIGQVFRFGYGRKIWTTGRGLLPWRIKLPAVFPNWYLEREYRTALLQEYIEAVAEWRMIRIGESYFGHKKLKRGEFHSGTALVGWERPPDPLLALVKGVCDASGFTSMCMDVLEGKDGQYYVNELQAVFSSYNPSQMYVDGKPGRFLWDEGAASWRWEEGCFNQNGSCNLRVLHLLELIGARK